MTDASVELSALTEESTSHTGPVAVDAAVDRGAAGLAEVSRAAARSLPQTGAFAQFPPAVEDCSFPEPWLQDALMALQRRRLSEPLPARFHAPLHELQRLLGRAPQTER